MLVVETLKGGLLHSIVLMIVYVFVLHLSHTCLFNFFIFVAEMRWCTEVCGNPQGSHCFCLLVIGLLELLLVCCSESCRQCDGARGVRRPQGGSLHSAVLVTVVICWLFVSFYICSGSVVVRGGVWRSQGGSLHSAVATRRPQDTPHRSLGSPTFF